MAARPLHWSMAAWSGKTHNWQQAQEAVDLPNHFFDFPANFYRNHIWKKQQSWQKCKKEKAFPAT